MAATPWTDQTRIYCLRDDVHRRCAGFVFGAEWTESIPNEPQVEANAVATAAQVWAAAKRYSAVGGTYVPAAGPHGTASIPSPVSEIMTEANAVGAARLCVEQMLMSGDTRLRDLKASLDSDWLRAIGDKHVGGDVVGEIGEAVSGSGSDTTQSAITDLDGSESTLEAMPHRDVRPPISSVPDDDPSIAWD